MISPSNALTFFFLLAFFSNPVGALTLTEIVKAPKEERKQKGIRLEKKKDLSMADVSLDDKIPKGAFGSSVTKQDVESKIQGDIQKKYGNDLAVTFSSWGLPGQKFQDISQFIIQSIEVNQGRTKITALVHFQLKDVLHTLKIRGGLEHMIQVPSLNRPIYYGETITEKDISWTKISGSKLSRFLITTPEGLIGHQPRRGFLKANLPLYQRDIEKVREIEKGSMVTVQYKTDRLELITKARALEHGYKGDGIRVLNQETNKILQGVVMGTDRVSLTPGYNQEDR